MKRNIIIIFLILLFIFIGIGYAYLETNLNVNSSVHLKSQKVFEFNYTGTYQVFTAPKTGTYKLETWGAQGYVGREKFSNIFGTGGYAYGLISLKKEQTLYVMVGGKWQFLSYNLKYSGGFNGGGSTLDTEHADYPGGGGGGATHISTNINVIPYEGSWNPSGTIIMSGGGGGCDDMNKIGTTWAQTTIGSGGGFIGNGGYTSSLYNANNGGNNPNQTYKVQGLGESTKAPSSSDLYDNGYDTGSGGGGWFGGSRGIDTNSSGGGGSGYIGNTLLTDKHMACYDCETSDEESTKTISVTCAKEEATSDCAKIGNGYARISYIGD